jgi:hypothetical protein
VRLDRSVMGTEAIKLITGIGEPLLGRLMIYDALEMSYRTIRIRKDPETPEITGLIDYEAFCGVPSARRRRGRPIPPSPRWNCAICSSPAPRWR